MRLRMQPREPASIRPTSFDSSISASSPRRTEIASRRAMMARSLENAGIPLDGVAAGMRRGALSLDFLDAAAYERFAALAPETFRKVSERTGSRSSC
jgi:hypothetical protein